MTPPATEFAVNCPKCGFYLENSYWNQMNYQPCGHCQTNVRLLVFPLAVEAQAAPVPNANAAQDEATCYNHSNKQAHVACATCGRFLCVVCEVEFRGEHMCPACLKLQAEGTGQPLFLRSKMRFDSLALILATLPAVIIYPTLVTAPAAIFLSIRYWNDDRGFLPRSGVRKYLALVFALLQIAAWIALGFFLIGNWGSLLQRRPR